MNDVLNLFSTQIEIDFTMENLYWATCLFLAIYDRFRRKDQHSGGRE